MESYELIAEMFEKMNEGSDESVHFIKDISKNHPCPIVRHEAVFCIGETASKDSVEFLKKVLEEDSNYVVKHEALVAIGTLGSVKDIPFLEKHIGDEIPEISNSALVGIQRIKDSEEFLSDVKNNKEKYIEDLKDFSKETQNRRIQILFQLMLTPDEDSINAISFSLKNDPSTVVRHEAGFVLGEIGTLYAVEKMKEALEEEKSPIVIHETLFALGTSGKKEALETIEKFLDDKDYVIRESAKIARDRLIYLKNPYSGARHFKEN